jgi:hypothetical protein
MICGIGTEPGHHEHRSPITSDPTDASGGRSDRANVDRSAGAAAGAVNVEPWRAGHAGCADCRRPQGATARRERPIPLLDYGKRFGAHSLLIGARLSLRACRGCAYGLPSGEATVRQFWGVGEKPHLVMHKHGDSKETRSAEREANSFASAFLMPMNDVKARVARRVTIDVLLKAKMRWRVSAMAMAYRLNALGLLSDWQYKSLCIELGKRGYRSSEPIGVERETSLIWRKVLGHSSIGEVSTELLAIVSPRAFDHGMAANVSSGCAPWQGGAFQWVQVPPGNRSSRKQPEQLWR